jgi:hypothetical protein
MVVAEYPPAGDEDRLDELRSVVDHVNGGLQQVPGTWV